MCWLISNSQLFNFVSWPNIFKNYSANNNDIFSQTFNLIAQLTSPSNQPVPQHVCSQAAEHFCKYVNIIRNSTDQEQKWNIDDPQDARESCAYFLNMLIDLRDPTSMNANALTITDKTIPQIQQMQTFIRSKFVFKTETFLRCTLAPKNKNSHKTKSESHFMMSLQLPAKNAPTSLQEICDNYFKEEIMTQVNCEHCPQRHSNNKSIKMAELNNEFVLLHLKRFETENSYEDYEQVL